LFFVKATLFPVYEVDPFDEDWVQNSSGLTTKRRFRVLCCISTPVALENGSWKNKLIASS
jgi:hypothetical protein